MSTMTSDMRQWLRDNRETFEFYMLHALMHDPIRRMALLNTPLLGTDFRREHYGLVVDALSRATKIMRIIGNEVPVPPSPEFLRTYVESAAKAEASDEDEIDEAMRLVRALQDPSYKEMHYCVDPYFEAWYGSARAKQAARDIQMEDIPDVQKALTKVQQALSSAAIAVQSEEDDEMMQVMDGVISDIKPRRPTGITGLDQSLNGGWGDHECYLLFGGTGSGKSIAAGQCAWHEASANGGYPLIVSTELRPREYVSRIVSNAASIKIPVVQDCSNFAQIRQAVAADPTSSYRLKKVDETLDIIRERVRIAKVSPEEGLDARAILEREVLRYERNVGHRPTWVCLDWLGTMADVGSGKQTSSERALAWEFAANGCVKFADVTGIPTLVLAQAVNDSQLKRVLVLNDIGIAKGIGKNMILVVGITNAIDTAGIKAAVQGKADMPKGMFLDDQCFCVCKARKGEGRNIQVKRHFLFQRFVAADSR